jgi:NodT family efflux transporter outer membrane factor (OMF) lipoprotein
LTGAVVRTAIDLARQRDQIEAVEGLLYDDEQTAQTVDRLFALHLKTLSDVEAARSQLAADRALLPPLRQQQAASGDALAILIGRPPGEFTPPVLTLDALTLPTDLPVAVPSELVRRRPDVRAAEAQLHAASAAIGVASAQLYPSLSLSGAITQESLTPPTLFTAAATGGYVAAGLAAPLFHGGALRAQKREAIDAFDGALANYRQRVLDSFGQVADVLQALDHDAQLLQAEQQSVEAATRALGAAQDQYAVSRADILQVLTAQRQLRRARIDQIGARARRRLDTVQLFAAMAGGWAQ